MLISNNIIKNAFDLPHTEFNQLPFYSRLKNFRQYVFLFFVYCSVFNQLLYKLKLFKIIVGCYMTVD